MTELDTGYWERLFLEVDRADPTRNGHRPEARPFPLTDLAALAAHGIDPPTLLCGDLLYRGYLHSLAGPPDSGKSTLLYLWMLQLLQTGERVVLLDEEGGREVVTEKFLALGATPDQLDRLAYVEFPTRTWDQADREGLNQLLADQRPALVGADSSAAFLTLAGHDENHAADVTRFYKGILLATARLHHTAVVVIDHITKDQLAGGRYARGSGAKLQFCDVAMMVDPTRSFSRHQDGLLKLKIPKDRRGYLHRDHEIRVSVADGAMQVTITRVEAPTESGSLSPAAAKLLAVLQDTKAPLSNRELVDRFAEKHGHGLRRETVSRELNAMLADGLVDAAGDGRDKRWFVPVQGGLDV